HVGHRRLVLESGLRPMEGRGQVEDLLAMLHGDDPAARVGAAVARPIDLVDDRRRRVARTQEVGVQRMGIALLHRPGGGGHGLGKHLAAEHPGGPDVHALAPEQVGVQGLQRDVVDQFLDDAAHDAVPRRPQAGLNIGTYWPPSVALNTACTLSPMRTWSRSVSTMLVSMVVPSSSVTYAIA